MVRVSDLWRWDGTIDRGPYVLLGLLCFVIKHAVDRLVAALVFSRPWQPWSYFVAPEKAMRAAFVGGEDVVFWAVMVALALPFIWIGVVLTLRRLRSVGLPTWLLAVFFVPFLNLVMFAVLCVLPARPAAGAASTQQPGPFHAALGKLIPDHPVGSAAMALLLPVPLGVLATIFGTSFLGTYGWGVFVGLPFCLGLASVLLYGYHRERTYGSCLKVSCISVLLLGGALVALPIEGAICLVMAMPLGMILALMGGSIGYILQDCRWTRSQATTVCIVLALVSPTLMGIERLGGPEAYLLAVRTSVNIGAPPEVVWRHVIRFSELPEPEEWIFHLGVAYPMKARIEGHGTGAIRYCEFSTGAFVEPIEVWDEPRALRFSVASSPDPMRELTPYAAIRPPHLAGSLRSERGQFLLVSLGDGRTRLEGTTWYRNQMWPSRYWQAWSDLIMERIHLRVLRHIKTLAEQDARTGRMAGQGIRGG